MKNTNTARKLKKIRKQLESIIIDENDYKAIVELVSITGVAVELHQRNK